MTTISTRFVIAAATLVAGIAITGAAVAQGDESRATERSGSTTTPAETPPDSTAPVRAAVPATGVSEQHGIVLEGTGSAGGQTVTVYVYENDAHGNSAQVVLGDPDDDRIGAVEQDEAFVVDGVLTASVDIDGRTATITGTVVPSGAEATPVDPTLDSEPTVVRGTHTRLDADLVVTYGDTAVPLTVSPAFAYDLEVRD
jgi:hypothetical protein